MANRSNAQDAVLHTDILDQLHDGVYLVDMQRTIRLWNRAAERISGFPAGDVVGSRCSDNILMHINEQGDRLCLDGCPLGATMADGDPREAEVYLHHKKGHRVPVHIRTTPLRDKDGRIVGGIEAFSDNSARSAMRREITELKRLALYDPLTEVGNRRYAEMALTSRGDEFRRYGWAYGVLIADIDHFKSVNDRFGHDAGDRVLRMVAQSLVSNVRVFDVVGRWGGEEFLVVLEKMDPEELGRRAEILRRLVEESSLSVDGRPLSVTVSIGGTVARPGEEPLGTVKRADGLLYRSKEAGRNRVTCECPGLAHPAPSCPGAPPSCRTSG